VLQLANNERVRLAQLSELISSDAAFASEVLTVANSLLYAPRFPATSILQAISVLGADHLQGMCMTVGMRAYLGRSLSDAAMRALWRHSLACAVIAERLAGAGGMSKDSAYTSGFCTMLGDLRWRSSGPRSTPPCSARTRAHPRAFWKAKRNCSARIIAKSENG